MVSLGQRVTSWAWRAWQAFAAGGPKEVGSARWPVRRRAAGQPLAKGRIAGRERPTLARGAAEAVRNSGAEQATRASWCAQWQGASPSDWREKRAEGREASPGHAPRCACASGAAATEQTARQAVCAKKPSPFVRGKRQTSDDRSGSRRGAETATVSAALAAAPAAAAILPAASSAPAASASAVKTAASLRQARVAALPPLRPWMAMILVNGKAGEGVIPVATPLPFVPKRFT